MSMTILALALSAIVGALIGIGLKRFQKPKQEMAIDWSRGDFGDRKFPEWPTGNSSQSNEFRNERRFG